MKILHAIQKSIRTKGEYTLLIEESRSVFHITSARVESDARKVSILDTHQIHSLERIHKNFFTRKKYDRIIVAFDATHAATVESSVTLSRANPGEMIREGELDSMLFHALWSFLNRFRPLAAKKLNVNELDLVIANIAVESVLLQGHKVFNPVDFSGKDLTFSFRATFIARSFLPVLEKISALSSSGPIVVERGTILASSLPRPSILFSVGDETALWYEAREDRAFLGTIPWGAEYVMRRVMDLFKIGKSHIPGIIERVLVHRVSDRICASVEKTVRDEYKVFRKMSEDLLKERKHVPVRGETRFAYFEDAVLPVSFFSDEYIRIVGAKEFGVEGVEIKKKTTIGDPSCATLALLFFPYVHPQYEYLNQLLRRRAKWLVPHGKNDM